MTNRESGIPSWGFAPESEAPGELERWEKSKGITADDYLDWALASPSIEECDFEAIAWSAEPGSTQSDEEQRKSRDALEGLCELNRRIAKRHSMPWNEPAEDLRVRLERGDLWSLRAVKAVHLDGVPIEHVLDVLMADERSGEIDVIAGIGRDDFMTETRQGHVEIIGLTDEQRRAHLAKEGGKS